MCCGATLLIRQATARGAEDTVITAVASKVSDDYVRLKRADGSYPPETYAFGEGGFWAGAPDASIDKLKFVDVARSIAGPLAAKNYQPARDPNQTRLLIMVYWGVTTAQKDSSSSISFQIAQNAAARLANVKAQAGAAKRAGDHSKGPGVFAAEDALADAVQMVEVENRQRDLADLRNGMMLGFDRELETAMRFKHGPQESHWQDLIDELEDDRYFVVLMAYDFPLLWKEKKHKLLWETRFSIRQRHNDFTQQLAAMAQEASRYFGQDSHGLIRERLHDTQVILGEPKVLGYEPEKK
jgi:hypothetical protein